MQVAKVWVLTYRINEYDQDGEYFARVFKNKPFHFQIEEVLKEFMDEELDIDHILAGGGREDKEYRWFFLKEHDIG